MVGTAEHPNAHPSFPFELIQGLALELTQPSVVIGECAHALFYRQVGFA